MNILALDTTSERGSVAVRRGGATVAQALVPGGDGFGATIFPAIEDILRQAGVPLAEIDCFAAACGPGSFSGVRVGLAVVKGLAAALDKPAAGISNLRALAWFGTGALRAVRSEARRGDVYCAVYDDQLHLVSPEEVLPLAGWQARFNGPEFEIVTGEQVIEGLAGAIAFCAEIDGPAGWHDPAELDASYVRRSDAQSFWEDSGGFAERKK